MCIRSIPVSYQLDQTRQTVRQTDMHYESSDVEKFSLAKNMSVVHCCGGYIRIFLVHMIFCRICWGHFLGMSHIFGDFRRSPDFLRSFSNKSLELLVIMVYPFTFTGSSELPSGSQPWWRSPNFLGSSHMFRVEFMGGVLGVTLW